MEFESNVGDLDNVVKVERRRAATIKNDVSVCGCESVTLCVHEWVCDAADDVINY